MARKKNPPVRCNPDILTSNSINSTSTPFPVTSSAPIAAVEASLRSTENIQSTTSGSTLNLPDYPGHVASSADPTADEETSCTLTTPPKSPSQVAHSLAMKAAQVKLDNKTSVPEYISEYDENPVRAYVSSSTEVSFDFYRHGEAQDESEAEQKIPEANGEVFKFKKLTSVDVFEKYLENPEGLNSGELYSRTAVVADALMDWQAEWDAIEKQVNAYEAAIVQEDKNAKEAAREEKVKNDELSAFAGPGKRKRNAKESTQLIGVPLPDYKYSKEELDFEKRKRGRLQDPVKFDDMKQADVYGFEYSSHPKHYGNQPIHSSNGPRYHEKYAPPPSLSTAENDGTPNGVKSNEDASRPRIQRKQTRKVYEAEQSTSETDDLGEPPAKRARKPKVFEDGVEVSGTQRDSRSATPAVRTFKSGKRIGRPPAKSKLQAVQLASSSVSVSEGLKEIEEPVKQEAAPIYPVLQKPVLNLNSISEFVDATVQLGGLNGVLKSTEQPEDPDSLYASGPGTRPTTSSSATSSTATRRSARASTREKTAAQEMRSAKLNGKRKAENSIAEASASEPSASEPNAIVVDSAPIEAAEPSKKKLKITKFKVVRPAPPRQEGEIGASSDANIEDAKREAEAQEALRKETARKEKSRKLSQNMRARWASGSMKDVQATRKANKKAKDEKAKDEKEKEKIAKEKKENEENEKKEKQKEKEKEKKPKEKKGKKAAAAATTVVSNAGTATIAPAPPVHPPMASYQTPIMPQPSIRYIISNPLPPLARLGGGTIPQNPSLIIPATASAQAAGPTTLTSPTPSPPPGDTKLKAKAVPKKPAKAIPPARPHSSRPRKPTRLAMGFDGADDDDVPFEESGGDMFKDEYERYQALTSPGGKGLGKRVRKPMMDLSKVMGSSEDDEL